MKKFFWVAQCAVIVWFWAGMWTIGESLSYAREIYNPKKSPMKTLEDIAKN